MALNRSQVGVLLEDIRKCTEKTLIYKKLVKIRTDVVKDSPGIESFYLAGGIKLLVNILNKPHEKILEVVLSILGNCCVKKECCKQAYEEGIIGPLISIISNIPNPSIQCRGCRLLGNLAQHSQISYAIGKKDNGNTAFALNSILNETENVAVLIMTARAIRQLWHEKNFRRLILGQGCVMRIIQILVEHSRNKESDPMVASTSDDMPSEKSFEDDEHAKVVINRMHAPDRLVTKEKFNQIVKHMENSHLCDIVGYQLLKTYRWKDNNVFVLPESKEEQELIIGLLKCLQMITTTVSEQVASEMYGENGSGYKCLVFLSSQDSPYRSLSLKLISNLASNPDSIEKLTNCDVITMVSDLLMYGSLEDSETRYCVTIMCLMTKEACNRGHIRRSGALKSFMKIAKQMKGQKELGMILYALYQYRFDQLSFEILLNNGAVNFLISVLKGIIENKNVEHIRNDDDDRAKVSVYSKRKSSHQKTVMKSSEKMFKYKKFDLREDYYSLSSKKSKLDPYYKQPDSPESGSSSGYGSSSYRNSGGNMSPSSSSCYSPSSTPPRISNDFEDPEDDNAYSPVCSENEDDDEIAAAQLIRDTTVENVEEEPENTEDDCEEEDQIKEFDILSYLYDDNSCGASEKPTIDEEIQQSLANRSKNYSFDHTIDDNETHDIELEIVSTKTFEKYPMQPILTLLWSVSRTNPFSEFVQNETLETLLKICRLAPRPRGRAFQVLSNILMHINHFLPLLKQDFVFRLHEFKTPFAGHNDCWSCDEMKNVCNELMALLGKVGETGYGHGEMAHILMTGEQTMQYRVAVIITFIIKEPKLLHKLLFEYNALETVMNLILNENIDKESYDQYLSNAACSGLTTLANNLSITGIEDAVCDMNDEIDDLLCCMNNSEREVNFSYNQLNNAMVTFKVNYRGRKESVSVRKSLLVDGSDVFSRMFCGDNFIESINNEVTLTEDVSAEGLRYFFDLIELQTKNELNNVAPPAKVITASLDALNLSKKYLLPKIEKSVLNIVKSMLNDDCVLTVFEWSMRQYNQELLLASTYYFLYSDISSNQKCKLFRLANRSSYRAEWKKLLVETILFKLQPNLDQ